MHIKMCIDTIYTSQFKYLNEGNHLHQSENAISVAICMQQSASLCEHDPSIFHHYEQS